ncbi:hypothetical protein TorRG33x02_339100 [Trema orientale]|uniref:Uncharacterized protein n=1 Tax=Trema orientale TaxID=63057 RepID=A0A2P5AWR4_TREOI|nr:hypothetical protein TorRG33x02_339100 [Trema orientale]
MGSNKRHYDITMSRRTRRPLKVRDNNGDDHSPKDSSPPKGAGDEGEENDRKSLKQLIDGDGNAKAVPSDEVGKGVTRSSLGEHLSDGENKQLQLVGVQQKGLHGLKLKKMVSRYAKILGHLMKKNRDSSLRESKKKQILMLTS